MLQPVQDADERTSAKYTKRAPATSRPKLEVAVGLSTGHTTLTARVETQTHTAAELATVSDEKKPTECMLHVTVWHGHAKDTETWVVRFSNPKI
jgi:hypothetical protein